MRLLLDTHVLLWALENESRLGLGAREVIANSENAVWVSIASAWEIAIKTGIGRLELDGSPEEIFPTEIDRANLQLLPISLDHALAVRTLPHHHRDPFDRLLISQARAEGLTLVTADRVFSAYDVATMDAAR